MADSANQPSIPSCTLVQASSKWGATALVALILGFLPACGGESASETEAAAPSTSNFDGPPVVVIGMDGLEWSVLLPLLKKGKLPNFQRLIDRGVAGGLTTFQPTYSPVVWTSIATGVPREKHGILYFSEMKDGRVVPDGLPYTSNSRKVPAVWNIASNKGRDILSVGWWVSWPAEKVNGRIVASYAAQAQGKIFWKAGVWEDGLPEMTYPDELLQEIFPHLEAAAPDGPIRSEYEELFNRIPGSIPSNPEAVKADPWAFPRGRDAFFRIGYHSDRTHLAIFKEQLQEQPADLNMVYFGLPDVAGHFWWRYREPGAYNYSIPDEHIAQLQQHIDRAYIAADGFLGEIVAVSPGNSRIMVLSDHGMHSGNFNNPVLAQSGVHEDAPPGVLIMAGPGIRADGLKPTVEWNYQVVVPVPGGKSKREPRSLMAPESVGVVYDITPTLLDWMGIEVSADMSGKSMRQHFTREWNEAHPLKVIASHGAGFRAATLPRVPQEGLDQTFIENLMGQTGIGYFETEDDIKALENN